MRPLLFLVEKMLQHWAISRREKNIAFEELVNRMEQLFILRKLVATVQTQFNNARQGEIVDSDDQI
jgi:hypothetical protein